MKRLRAHYGCPVELALEFVGGKWKTVILAWLKEAPHRYGELRARMSGVTDKVLTQRLKELEALDLIEKFAIADEGAKTAYRLTSRGESLPPTLNALCLGRGRGAGAACHDRRPGAARRRKMIR